jgi:hypothetical protein
VLNGERAASIGMQYPAEIRRAVNERTAKVIDVAIDDALRGPNVVRFPNK